MTVIISSNIKKETIWLDKYGNRIDWPRWKIISTNEDTWVEDNETDAWQNVGWDSEEKEKDWYNEAE